MRILKYISIFLLIALIGLFGYRKASDYQTFRGEIFGTYYHIKIRSHKQTPDLEQKILNTLSDINNHMSVFDKQSEISRLNQTPAEKSFRLSPQLSKLLKASNEIYKNSGGAFDPAIGELVNLWGFGPNNAKKNPSEREIKEILNLSGFNKLRFNKDFTTVVKTHDDTKLNLSAIAKGYGVDKTAALLEELGYRDYIVEIGGEIRLSGSKDSRGNSWSVGLADPQKKGRNLIVLDMTDIAIATSGDYNNFFYKNGRRYAHTISPQTGYPVEHNLASVTVFHSDCMRADAYATAVMSLGEVKGLELMERLKLSAILFIRTPDDKIEIKYSAAAKEMIEE